MATQPPSVGDYLLVRYYCYRVNQVAVNNIHFKVLAISGTAPSLQEIADYMSTALAPQYTPVLDNTAEYLGCTVSGIWPLPATVTALSQVGAGNGTGGATPLPGQVSGIISAFTNRAGRGFRGRAYIPFPSTAFDQGDGTPTATYISLLDTLAQGLYDAYNPVGAGGDLIMDTVIYKRDTPTISEPVTGVSPRDKWATQRRRGNYGKENPRPF